MSALLQREIADYTARRDRLVSAILDFSDWLDRHRGMDAERNLRIALDPIMVRIMEHKALLGSRLDNLKQTLANMDQLKARMLELKSEAAELKRQHTTLDGLAARLKD